MRLIDANKFLKWLDVGHLRNPAEICLSEINVKNMIDLQPTIDPESLPIVQQLMEKVKNLNIGIENLSQVLKIAYDQRDNLKEKLERVTAERDAAIADLKILADCDYCKYDCKNYEEDDCRFCSEKKCKCRTCKDGSSWEWRGLVAENATAESVVQPNDQP